MQELFLIEKVVVQQKTKKKHGKFLEKMRHVLFLQKNITKIAQILEKIVLVVLLLLFLLLVLSLYETSQV